MYNFYASPFRFVEILSKRIVRYARDYENATRLVGWQRAGCNFNEDELNGNRFNATHRVASQLFLTPAELYKRDNHRLCATVTLHEYD